MCDITDSVIIEELTEYEPQVAGELDALMHELSPGAAATGERVRRVVEDPNMHQYAAFEEGRMVGCATLCVCHTPEMVVGFVEAVVVASAFRGRHIGRMLMERMVADARGFGVQQLHLTSNPLRVAANGLYQALGFEKKETNVYIMKL